MYYGVILLLYCIGFEIENSYKNTKRAELLVVSLSY